MPGYKRTVTAARPFIGALKQAMQGETVEDGVTFSRITIDYGQGPMKQTDRALDFAIEGNAFFVIADNSREYYTRNGAFFLDTEGNLVTAGGLRVAGDVTVPPNTVVEDIAVDPDGTVRNGRNALGRIQLAGFESFNRLMRAGPSMFAAPAGVSPETPGSEVKVYNRMLEQSNSSVVQEMTDLIVCMRNFESCKKMIEIQDRQEGAMITQLAQ